MPRPRLAASITMTPGWDLGACLDAWTELEIPAIGLTRSAVEAHGVDAAIAAVRASGLSVSDYQQVTPYRIVEPEAFAATLDDTARQLDVAAALGADCVYLLTGPRGPLTWDEAGRRLVDQTRRILPLVHERGLRVGLELLQPLRQDLTFLNMVADVLELLREIDDPAVGYVFDMWHVWWQRDIVGLARASAAQVVSVQVCDHKEVTLRTLDRAMPGAGIGEVAPLLAALESGGYRGYYELEVISPDIEELGYRRALCEAIERLERMWPDDGEEAA